MACYFYVYKSKSICVLVSFISMVICCCLSIDDVNMLKNYESLTFNQMWFCLSVNWAKNFQTIFQRIYKRSQMKLNSWFNQMNSMWKNELIERGWQYFIRLLKFYTNYNKMYVNHTVAFHRIQAFSFTWKPYNYQVIFH